MNRDDHWIWNVLKTTHRSKLKVYFPRKHFQASWNIQDKCDIRRSCRCRRRWYRRMRRAASVKELRRSVFFILFDRPLAVRCDKYAISNCHGWTAVMRHCVSHNGTVNYCNCKRHSKSANSNLTKHRTPPCCLNGHKPNEKRKVGSSNSAGGGSLRRGEDGCPISGGAPVLWLTVLFLHYRHKLTDASKLCTGEER